MRGMLDRVPKTASLKILFLTGVFLLVLSLAAQATGTEDVDASLDQQTADQILLLLQQRYTSSGQSPHSVFLLTHKALGGYYAKRAYQPVWQKHGALLPAADQLVEHLRGAAEHGLCSDVYLLDQIEGMIYLYNEFARHQQVMVPSQYALLDLMLTQAFLTYATHLVEGQVDPALAHVDWKARRRKANLTRLLTYALKNNRLEQVLNGLLPPHPGYQALVKSLADYRELAALGGWLSFPEGPTLRPGDQDERVPLLRERLQMTGDLSDESDAADLHYGEADVEAVRAFQERHGLIVDGAVGKRTRQSLNVTVEHRIRQIELNLERWRWMPKSLGERYVQVNIADFSLSVVEGESAVLSMPVIVGTAYRRTPVFSAKMTYLELAPTWTVPPTILREDKLPAIKADPDYLKRKHFRLLQRENDAWVEVDTDEVAWSSVKIQNFPGILRQDPGPWNPLGRIKFMFPNRFNVYLHDTNERHLFANQQRTFSSGCIRVAQPLELAHYLLRGVEGWGDDRLEAGLQRSEPLRVDIPELPVHVQYWTAWVDADERVQFRSDIYYRDLDLDVALSEPDYQVESHLEISKSGPVSSGEPL